MRKSGIQSLDPKAVFDILQSRGNRRKGPELWDTLEEAALVSRHLSPQGRVVRTRSGKYTVVPRDD